MAIFWNIFLKTLSIFLSISIITLIIISLLNILNTEKTGDFVFISGDQESPNSIVVIELNGLIINSNNQFSELINPLIISPPVVKKILDELQEIDPKVIIFSMNSPGGTVSASKNLYDIIKNFKKENNTEILFHTNELLASGGYWVSISGDKIYANYGSIVGSIGVKGPDWFFYDQPISFSTGLFSNKIETKNGIKVFSNIAGKSKDIFNSFREPTNYELEELQSMVDEIYDDFVRIVSRERKIETNTIVNEIGALIYTTGKAEELHLIDGEISLDNLIKKTIVSNNYNSFKILKKYNNKNSLIKEIFQNNSNQSDIKLNTECLTLRSSISAIMSYQTTGC
tara:strand:+ start:101 stop:1123 length:1023 start_codon:yes stop_codon:yes gene_type:complete